MNFWLIPLLLFVPVPQSIHPPDAVIERLAKTGVFALGIEKLYAIGNGQAKCYALVGIHRLDPARFAELAQPLRDSKETVTTMSGCVMSGQAFGDVIKQIESGRFS